MPFVAPPNSGHALLTAVGTGNGNLAPGALDVMSGFTDNDLRHCATHGLAKASSDHTLGGSDGHASGIVEKVLLADGVLSEGAFHRWIPTLNANAGGGQRTNTGDREVLKVVHRTRHHIDPRFCLFVTSVGHPTKGFRTYLGGLLATTPDPSRFVMLRGGALNQMQVSSKTFANIFGGFIDLVTNESALPVITGENWYNDLSRAAVGIARNFLREHTSAMWFMVFSYHGQARNTDELGLDLPPVCALHNATPAVGTMLACVREYCARLHSQSRLLSSELVTQAMAVLPAFANFVAALRRTRRQQLSQEAADLLAAMMGRAGADVVNVAVAMVAVSRAAWARLNGPLVPPNTLQNCPWMTTLASMLGRFGTPS